jgi:8-oxo-dGTP pyrophosphatase MutT (NUDIX family)
VVSAAGGKIGAMPHADTLPTPPETTAESAADRSPACPADWPAIAAASDHDPDARLPFLVTEAGQDWLAGSVARNQLGALARWPEALRLNAQGVTLTLPAAERDAFLADANRSLHAAGLILGWRDETYPLTAIHGGALLARIERAAARFWGSTTFGAHCNGWLADGRGKPAQLWIARRAFNKPTDPGKLDNLIGGGVPLGQSPAQTLVREGWEEAGLLPAQMTGLLPGRRFQVLRDVAEGLQREQISVFDLALPPGLQPHNQDGEVHSFTLMPVAQALDHAAAGDMTVDAALVTLDFALRHRLLSTPRHQHLQALAAALWMGRSQLDH